MILRVGRKVGRTLYRQLGAEPSDDDPLVGVMDTRELADAVVAAFAAVSPPAREKVSEPGAGTQAEVSPPGSLSSPPVPLPGEEAKG